MKKNFARILCISVVAAMCFSFAGCGQKSDQGPANTTAQDQSSQTSVSSATNEKSAEPVTIRFISAYPDRKSGAGLAEQMLLDNFAKEYPNITIEQEQVAVIEPKIQAYMASNDLPDVVYALGNSAYMSPLVNGGYLQELNKSDYDSDGFIPGSLDTFTYNGKLYGLPRSSDFMVLYCNKALFDQNGIKIPATYSELLAAVKAFRAKNITPMSLDGKDQWPAGTFLQQLALSYGGDQKAINNDMANASFAADPIMLKAAQMAKELNDLKAFQEGQVNADYGTARNYFGQGKAAMYYMGAWESGMATDEAFSDDFKKNLVVVPFPAAENNKSTDIMAWNGGGTAVSANSKNKEAAMTFFNYIFRPEQWAKLYWQTGAGMPAQKFDQFMTGQENDVQKTLVNILGSATSISGLNWYDTQTPDFKTQCIQLSEQLFAGAISPEDFLKEVDKQVAALKQ